MSKEKSKYIVVEGEEVEVLEVVQEDAENNASLITTTDQTHWVNNKEIKSK